MSPFTVINWISEKWCKRQEEAEETRASTTLTPCSPTPTEEQRTRLKRRRHITDDSTLWRAEAWAAYAQVEDELQRAEARMDAAEDVALTHEAAVVRGDLDDALAAMVPKQSVRGGLKRYYSGGDISKTWSAIHRAGESLFAVYEEAELHAQATRLEDLVAALPDSKSSGKVLSEAREDLKSTEPEDKRKVRAMLRQLYREAIGTTEGLQAEARVLRNTLLVASIALGLVVFAFGVVNLLDVHVFPLCTPDGKTEICPTGGAAHRFDTFAVELAGMLGGILSVVIPLATGERIKTPYRVFNHQLLLKVIAGAGTALAGIILIQSAFVTTITLNSTAAIIGYAVFFGFSQQALTGIIDRRANELGKETPNAKTV